MKLDEIQTGEEYAVKANRHGDPRRVRALGIVPVEERQYDSVREIWRERTVRKVKVKFLDKPQDRYDYTKGVTVNLKAQEIQAPWSEVGPALRERLERAAERDKFQDGLEKRVKKLLGRNYDGYVMVDDIENPRFRVNGKSFLKLLDLAEKGKA